MRSIDRYLISGRDFCCWKLIVCRLAAVIAAVQLGIVYELVIGVFCIFVVTHLLLLESDFRMILSLSLIFPVCSMQVFGYDEGYCYFVGIGHSGSIQQARIAPDQQTVVTVGDEGQSQALTRLFVFWLCRLRCGCACTVAGGR